MKLSEAYKKQTDVFSLRCSHDLAEMIRERAAQMEISINDFLVLAAQLFLVETDKKKTGK